MSKSVVTRLFIASLIAFAAGAVIAISAVGLAIATDVAGSNFVGVQGGALAWSLLGLGIVGGLVIAGGLVSGVIAWIGALLNTRQLESKTWFAVLLLTGIFNFGFISMIAYVIAGPDGSAVAPRQPAPARSAA